jgi:MurNAc alpha-1-phosphate uridylyltransferase
MMERWDDKTMDALLLLHNTVDAYGYEGDGDFLADPLGRLTRRTEREIAPYLFTGVQILHPRLFEGAPTGKYSLNVLYDRAIENERLYGIVHDGEWFHIGTPEGLAEAEAFLRDRFPGKMRR